MVNDWYARNKGSVDANKRRWRENNKPACRAIVAKRKAVILQAMPSWVDASAIRRVYKIAGDLGLDVDHMIPLQSKVVCGLHVPANIRPLSAFENSRKFNRFDPDEWQEIMMVENKLCRACGEPVAFRKLPSGKWTPCELDGSDHWDKCAQRQAVIVRREGKYFTRTGAATTTDNVREEGYKWRGKEKFVKLDGVLRVGANYVPPDHDCPTPPWEDCRCVA